ncbi:MAG: hypothetical protein ACPGJV_05185 [Bacteriovoracaceae bacterium]
MISVILTGHKESKNSFFWENLEALKNLPYCQVIVVLEEHDPETFQKVKSYGTIELYSIQSNNRAKRINHGIDKAAHSKIIILHPRSFLSPKAYNAIENLNQDIAWGAFTHRFDEEHPILKFTSFYSNQVRLKYGKIAYLDHCFFINRDHIPDELLKVPEADIFEDTLYSRQLSQVSVPKLFEFDSVTSSIRFKKNGILFQVLMNQCLKVGFHLGLSDQTMNKIYEKGLSLNSKYQKKD